MRVSNTTKPVDSLAATPVMLGGKNILVVDDEVHIRELLRQELEAEGYTIREAQDGVQAMAMIKQQRPDLIILDVMMPNISGFDVVAMLKTDPTMMDVPIIILSIVEDKDKGFRLGVDRYLTKPLNTKVLFNEVEQLLEQGASSKKVMVMDDDATVAGTLTEVLSQRGYQVTAVTSSSELISRAKTTRPDMIVANSGSPEKLKLVQELRFEKGLENVYILMYQ